MPIYEYRCASCGHDVEALQKFSDAPLTVCPACHKADLRKRVSAAGFQLKGSGWYVTDFRNSGAKQPAKEGVAKANGGNGAADAPSSPPTNADSKPSASTGSEAKSGGAGEPTATSPVAPAKTGG